MKSKNTILGVNVWDSWGKWRNDSTIRNGLNESSPCVLVPPWAFDLQAHELNHWLCRFVLEVSSVHLILRFFTFSWLSVHVVVVQ